MNRLMLAILSVFALTIAATPSVQGTIAARPPAGDLNPRDRNNPMVRQQPSDWLISKSVSL